MIGLIYALAGVALFLDAAAYAELKVTAAIEVATTDEHERRLLWSIAWHESRLRPDVVFCRTLGFDGTGSAGAWQVIARGPDDHARLCRTVAGDAVLALERVRESLAACAHLPESDRLAVYVAGSCSSARGRRMSRVRWVP